MKSRILLRGTCADTVDFRSERAAKCHIVLQPPMCGDAGLLDRDFGRVYGGDCRESSCNR